MCGKIYKASRSLKIHQKTHGEPTIQCPECPAKFHQNFHFERHFKIHKNLKYKCKNCTLTYASTKSLNKHIRKLDIFFDFTIQLFFFFQLIKLLVHFYKINISKMLLYHISERVHKKQITVNKICCPLCNFKFKGPKYLRMHMISHTGERCKWIPLNLARKWLIGFHEV